MWIFTDRSFLGYKMAVGGAAPLAARYAGFRESAAIWIGLLAGGAAGSVLSGGLNDLLKQFQQNGQGDAVDSWVGTGPNKEIPPKDLANALGADRINALVEQTGMSRDELLAGLSQHLPDVINQLTPHGRLPNPNEVSI